MREIVYIGAGESSNYVATHFWNTQQAYFTYGEDEQSFVDHDISWREGYDRSVRVAPEFSIAGLSATL